MNKRKPELTMNDYAMFLDAKIFDDCGKFAIEFNKFLKPLRLKK